MSTTEAARPRVRPTPALYRQLVEQFERRRRELGWSCEKVDQVAGLSDRYYAKLIHPDTPSGRCANWDTLDLVTEAMWPREQFRVVVRDLGDAAAISGQRRGMYG